MDITINIYYKGENGNVKKFVNEMISSGIVDRVREEEGNERYEYFFPMDDEETVLLIDKWKSKEALDIHHKSEMMKKIADLRSKYQISMKVEKFKSLKEVK